MSAVTATAHARAGLLGNPSDGYFGRTIALCIEQFAASVTVERSSKMLFPQEPSSKSLSDFSHQVDRFGYYGSARLIKAALRIFLREYPDVDPSTGLQFSYETNIPRQLGLAGSSAIVVATLKALAEVLAQTVPPERLALLALDAERKELGIEAGPQDRVAQAYGGIVAMDFSTEQFRTTGVGTYRKLQAPSQSPLFALVYDIKLSKVSGRVLTPLRERFESGDRQVIESFERLKALVEKGEELLRQPCCNTKSLGELMNENFAVRRQIMSVPESALSLWESLQALDTPAKFAGSGGSFLCLLHSNEHLEALKQYCSGKDLGFCPIDIPE